MPSLLTAGVAGALLLPSVAAATPGSGSSAAAVHYSPAGFGCVDAATQKLPYCDPSLSVAARAADLVGRLTLAEKIGLTGSFTGDLCSDIDTGVPRLSIPNVTQLIEVTGAVSSACYVDPKTNRSLCPTVFPAPLALAAAFSRPLWRLKGAVTGQEARAFNNLNVPRIYAPDNYVGLLGFGPDVNLIVDPRNGRNGENPTEDPALGGFYVEEVVRGQQEGEDPNYIMLSSALKHYAGYERETDRFASNDNISNFDLLDTYLPPYARGLQQGKSTGTMCSYNSLNSVPACAHHWLLTSLVREFWGRPDATHTSDCGAIEDQFSAKHWASSFADATAKSIAAGTDSCIGTAFQQEHGIADAIGNGTLTEAAVDAALARTLAVRFRLGMFDPPNATVYTTYGPEHIHTAAATAAAEAAAAQGAVLLRNEHFVLPLDATRRSLRTVAVVGPHAVTRRDLLGDFYGDAFCPGVSNRSVRADGCVVTFAEAVSTYLASAGRADVDVLVEPGTDVKGDDATGLAAAVAAAGKADVVVLVVGYNNQDVEREGADHTFTSLPGLQTNLTDAVVAAAAERGAQVVMVLVNAGQIALDTLAAQPPAIVEAFYPAFGAPALVAQLFGATNRWGRLPYTMYPAAFADAVNLSDMRVSTGPVGRTYRYYSGAAGPALYEFGHGLSYASFASSCGTTQPGGGDEVTVRANTTFAVPLECSTRLQSPPASASLSSPRDSLTDATAGPAGGGDEILLAFHRAGADVRAAAAAAAHPVPAYSLRDFQRVDDIGDTPGQSAFTVRPLDLALVNSAGASMLYPGTHFIDVSPRPPGKNWTLTVHVQGDAPVALSTPPPLPPAWELS